MTMRTALLVVPVLLACSRGPEPVPVEDAGTNPIRPTLEIGPDLITPVKGSHVADLTAEELVELVRTRDDPQLTAELRAVLAEYDGVLAGIMTGAQAKGLVPDASRPHLTTRDYVLWVLPGAPEVCFTIEDRAGRVLAERIDEVKLSRDFPYLHNLLHPEYKQFYDAVDY